MILWNWETEKWGSLQDPATVIMTEIQVLCGEYAAFSSSRTVTTYHSMSKGAKEKKFLFHGRFQDFNIYFGSEMG